ncbi:hypothetical protein BB561_005688 [Smittium simulii]|uniref:Septin-type G domain-containing protein n=1 Tax=Smittium simulii TaxID=133385 RepID=A0A2T9Y8Y2_9FUNG|nr:hypothetical protein BB561_005688 [Smittium simulii]
MLGSSSKSYASTVINAPLSAVWNKTKDLDFSFWSAVQSCTLEANSPQEVGGCRKVTFKDGTVQTFRVIEISEINNSITYELIDSTPAVSFMSVVSTISLNYVTSNNSCFVSWDTTFSSDGGIEVTQDSYFKKQDALSDLEKSNDIGKSSTLYHLFGIPIPEKLSENSSTYDVKHMRLETSKHCLQEGDATLDLTIIRTAGLWNSPSNQNCWDPILYEIETRYNHHFDLEMNHRLDKETDGRIHCFLYFIKPTGNALNMGDIEMLTRIHKKVNLIPIIAKADTLTPAELSDFKALILSDFEKYKITTYRPSDLVDSKYVSNFDTIYPLAIVSGTQIIEKSCTNFVYGRVYPWGNIEVNNKSYSDFPLLRDIILKVCMLDLKHTTDSILYETFRTNRLLSMGVVQKNLSFTGLDNIDSVSASRLKAIEKEMSSALELQINTKEKVLTQAENELKKRYSEKSSAIQKRRLYLEDCKKKLLSFH